MECTVQDVYVVRSMRHLGIDLWLRPRQDWELCLRGVWWTRIKVFVCSGEVAEGLQLQSLCPFRVVSALNMTRHTLGCILRRERNSCDISSVGHLAYFDRRRVWLHYRPRTLSQRICGLHNLGHSRLSERIHSKLGACRCTSQIVFDYRFVINIQRKTTVFNFVLINAVIPAVQRCFAWVLNFILSRRLSLYCFENLLTAAVLESLWWAFPPAVSSSDQLCQSEHFIFIDEMFWKANWVLFQHVFKVIYLGELTRFVVPSCRDAHIY